MDRLDSLRLFVEITDHGSLSSAARARAVAPSTVTYALQRLEEEVGARLLVRSTRSMSLTAEGERFLGDCKRILADLDEAFDAVADRGRLRGTLRITSTNDFGRARLAPIIDAFARLHPDVRFELVLTDGVVDLVDQGFDAGIRTGPFEDSNLRTRQLVAGQRCVCAAPRYWAQRGRPSHPRELAAHDCMILERPGAPQRNWRFRAQGRAFSVKVGGRRASNDGAVLRHWAVAGAGVIVKARWDVEEDIAAGRLETVLDDFMAAPVNLCAVFPPARRTSKRLVAFVDFLHHQLSST